MSALLDRELTAEQQASCAAGDRADLLADEALNTTHWADAEDALLDDIAAFSDWISENCAGASAVHLGYVPTRQPLLSMNCERSTLAELVALMLYPDAGVCVAAARELRARYLHERQARVLQLAGGIRRVQS